MCVCVRVCTCACVCASEVCVKESDNFVEELGVPRLRAVCEQHLGAAPRDWYWTYRVRYAVKE